MAQVVENHEFPKAGRKKFNVPAEWLDGKSRVLSAPEDFEAGKGKSAANAVKRAAQEAGKSVLVDERELDKNIVVVQAIAKRPAPKKKGEGAEEGKGAGNGKPAGEGKKK